MLRSRFHGSSFLVVVLIWTLWNEHASAIDEIVLDLNAIRFPGSLDWVIWKPQPVVKIDISSGLMPPVLLVVRKTLNITRVRAGAGIKHDDEAIVGTQIHDLPCENG